MKTSRWFGCYDEAWKGVIPDSAFEHPAKFSKRLVERIIEHMEKRGWLVKEERPIIADPFAGVRLGGVIAAYRGYQWVGVELEQRFIDLGDSVCTLHRDRWARLGVPAPICVKGDSRRFDELIREAADAVVSSPPYISGGHHADVFDAWNNNGGGQSPESTAYGKTDGQISQLKEGTIGAVVTSPVYSGNDKSDYSKQERRKPKDKRTFGGSETYGKSAGQIGTLKTGKVDAVVASPPFLRAHGGERGIMVDGLHTADGRVHKGFKERQYRDGDRDAANTEAAGHGDVDAAINREVPVTIYNYENLGFQKQTYWEAMLEVYSATFRALKPGGVMAIVVKDFVKDGRRQRLCDDTLKLLQHIGFEGLERARAMLVQEWTAPDLFTGTSTTRKTRKSFFRRHLEKDLAADDQRRIDWEEVLFVQKPIVCPECEYELRTGVGAPVQHHCDT